MTLTYISFENAGTLDKRCISVMGTNVKTSDNAIGYFGTGLKMALAVLARNEIPVTIRTGGETLRIHSRTEVIRDKAFQVCYMNDERLPFTTELAKNWTLENAYRELYANAIDEGGDVVALEEVDDLPSGFTSITITCPAHSDFLQVHYNRDEFILDTIRTRRILVNDTYDVEVYDRPSRNIFYKSFAASEYKSHFNLTYNYVGSRALTEDRTLRDTYRIPWEIGEIIANLSDKHLIYKLVTTGAEAEIANFTFCSAFSPAAMEVGKSLLASRDQPETTNASFLKRIGELCPPDLASTFTFVRDPEAYDELLTRAKDFLTPHIKGFQEIPVYICRDLPNAMGIAHKGKVYLDRAAFTSFDLLVTTLAEEYIHILHEVPDCSRSMQEVLFNYLYTSWKEGSMY